MFGRIGSRLSYANVMATIAVFGVLGGGAYAVSDIGATDIKRNAIRAKHVKRDAIKRAEIAAAAVRGAEIADGAVAGGEIADGAVGTAELGDDAATGAKVAGPTLGTVPNADLLDGIDSASLLRGNGRTFVAHGTDAPSGGASDPIPLDIGGNFTLNCNNPASAGSDFTFTNTSGSSVEVWSEKVQDGFADDHVIFYSVVPNGSTASMSVSGPVVLSGRNVTAFTISSGNRLTRIEARVVFTAASECSFNVLATELTR